MRETQLYRDYRSHIAKRMRERFHINTSPDKMMVSLSAAVKKGTFLERSKYARKVYMVRVYNQNIVLVYDHRHDLPITIMRPEGFVE